jgi:hypothetical protein
MDIDSRNELGRRKNSTSKNAWPKLEPSEYSLTIVVPPSNGYDTNNNKAESFSKIKSEGVAVWSTQLKESDSKDIKNLMILVTPRDGIKKELQGIQDIFLVQSLTCLKIVWVTNDGDLCNTPMYNYKTKQFEVPKIEWPHFPIVAFRCSTLELQSCCPPLSGMDQKWKTIEINLHSEAKRIDIANSSATRLLIISTSSEGSNLKSINLYQSEPLSLLRLTGANASSLCRKIKDSINAEKKDSIKIWKDNRTILFSNSNFRGISNNVHEISIPLDSFHSSDLHSGSSTDPSLDPSSDPPSSSSKSFSSRSSEKSCRGCCCTYVD